MRKAIVFNARRDGYAIEQIADEAVTVGELIEFLSEFDSDTLFVLSHDNGYTYGSIDIMMDGEIYKERKGDPDKFEGDTVFEYVGFEY